MLINLRNALMAGKRLPYDAEVEYLESTGTQWIDTGVAVTDPSTVSVSVTKVSGNFNFGLGHANVTAGTWLGVRTSILNKAYFKNFSTTVDVPNTWQQLRWDGSSGLYADGALVGAKSARVGTDAISSTSWPIFAMHEFNGGGVSQYSAGQISSVQIAVSGVLVRDFIPVRKGTVGYLYDRVSGRLFGNAGTGDFVLGQDVVPVEYIESHGTERINTGINIDTGTDAVQCDVLFLPDTGSGYKYYFGTYGTPTGESTRTYYALAKVSGSNSVIIYIPSTASNGYSTISVGTVDESWHTVQMGSSGLYFDGVNKTGSIVQRTVAFGVPFALFAGIYANDGRPRNYCKARLRHFQISRNNTLVRAYTPVRVGTDATSWEGAMMDVLTRRIYRNAGTGAFTYGNDLKYPIPAA